MTLLHKAFLATILLTLGAARADAGSLTVMWDPNPESHVAGYTVYVGTQPGVHSWTYDVGNATSFVFPNAVAGQMYYVAVAAYAPGPLIGPKSHEVSGYSNAPPTLTHPGNQVSRVGQPAVLQLAGHDPYGEPVSYSATGLPPGLVLTPSTGLIQGTGTTAGTYQVSARVTDGVLSDTKAFTWTMEPAADTQAPVVAITGPTSASSFTTTTASITLSGSATDNVGVTAVTWASDRGGSGTAAGTTSWTASAIPLQLGANVITVRARDAAGNQGSAILSVTYADGQAPVVAVTSPTAASSWIVNTSGVTLAGTATDNVAVTAVTWSSNRGGTGLASGTTSWTAAGIPLQSGSNVITVTAHDAAGNKGTVAVTVTFQDTEAPQLAIVSPTSTGAFSTGEPAVTLAGTAMDNVGVVSVSWATDTGAAGVAAGTTNWNTGPIALQAGETRIVVTARDAAGNQASATLVVSQTLPPPPTGSGGGDTVAPTLSIMNPTKGSKHNTSAETLTVSGVASDNVGVTGVTWVNSLGGSGTASGTSSWQAEVPLREGDNVLTFQAHDAAGNTSSVVLTVSRKSQTGKK